MAGLNEEQREAYREFIEALHEMADACYKLPTDPVANGLIEMAAEIFERQIQLDIVFPMEDGEHGVHEHHMGQPVGEAPFIIPQASIPNSNDVKEITDPKDFLYLGKKETPPSADDLKKWFDGYSPN